MDGYVVTSSVYILPVLKWCVGIGNEKRVPDKRLFKVQSSE
jgi:hypothetical protein